MRTVQGDTVDAVHCRVGSSEKAASARAERDAVHCRVGSSEMQTAQADVRQQVHCRVGSSETGR